MGTCRWGRLIRICCRNRDKWRYMSCSWWRLRSRRRRGRCKFNTSSRGYQHRCQQDSCWQLHTGHWCNNWRCNSNSTWHFDRSHTTPHSPHNYPPTDTCHRDIWYRTCWHNTGTYQYTMYSCWLVVSMWHMVPVHGSQLFVVVSA
jgi:hypothetical protein